MEEPVRAEPLCAAPESAEPRRAEPLWAAHETARPPPLASFLGLMSRTLILFLTFFDFFIGIFLVKFAVVPTHQLEAALRHRTTARSVDQVLIARFAAAHRRAAEGRAAEGRAAAGRAGK